MPTMYINLYSVSYNVLRALFRFGDGYRKRPNKIRLKKNCDQEENAMMAEYVVEQFTSSRYYLSWQ